MLREDNTRSGFFERAQFESVRAQLPADFQSLVTVGYYTGWRMRSELLPLEWRQVDLKAGTIRLEPGTTKNREARVFVFKGITELERTFKTLAAQRDRLRAKGVILARVFLRVVENRKKKTEHIAQIRHFRRTWLTACKAADCPGRIPHDFRRTAVRNLVRAGVPERVAVQITGHKTRSVFRALQHRVGSGPERGGGQAGGIDGDNYGDNRGDGRCFWHPPEAVKCLDVFGIDGAEGQN